MCVRSSFGMVLTVVGAGLLAACSEGGSPVDQGGTGHIAGSVVNPLSNAGVGGIPVRAQSTASGSHSTITNQAGGYLFTSVATGGWSITIEVPGGMEYASSETGVRTVTVERGQTVNTQAFHIVNVAQLQGAIAGRVAAGGNPVSGAVLTILNAAGEPSTTTDANGNYGFEGLEPRTYGLEITPPSGYQLPAGESAQRAVTVVAEATATLDWTLQASGGNILDARRADGAAAWPIGW
ncbi:MAG: carboxypeptidase regulatory-like domain-containing protein [Gemmatimonadota bacterium]